MNITPQLLIGSGLGLLGTIGVLVKIIFDNNKASMTEMINKNDEDNTEDHKDLFERLGDVEKSVVQISADVNNIGKKIDDEYKCLRGEIVQVEEKIDKLIAIVNRFESVLTVILVEHKKNHPDTSYADILKTINDPGAGANGG